MCPKLSSGSLDLQRTLQCFVVILLMLQKYTRVLRVHSIAFWYRWINWVVEWEKPVSKPNKLLWVNVTKPPIHSNQIWKVCIKLYPVELKKVFRALEMYFHTSFPILCYNFGQDHVREQSFKLDEILCAAQIYSTHWLRIRMAQAECFQFWKDCRHPHELVVAY